MDGSPGRLELLAAVVTLAGLWIGGRSLVRLARAARARCTYGAPYKSGMIGERLTGFLMTLPVLILGLALIFLATAQAAFQPAGTTVRVGRIEATRCGPGCVTARFIPDPSYPAREAAVVEIVRSYLASRWTRDDIELRLMRRRAAIADLIDETRRWLEEGS